MQDFPCHFLDHYQHAFAISAPRFRIKSIPGERQQPVVCLMVMEMLKHESVASHRLCHACWREFREGNDVLKRSFTQEPVGLAIERGIQVVFMIPRSARMMSE